MKQIRFEPLIKTYQKLSTLLCNTALSIQATNYTIDAEWARLIQEVKMTVAVFKSYAEKEEHILFPLLHAYEPALVAILRDEQYTRMRYLNDLADLFDTKQAATDKHKSKLFSHKLLYNLNEFVATVLQQLNGHESMINAVLWRYYSDKELTQFAALLSVTPTVMAQKKNTAFADNIINNVIPVATGQSNHKQKRRNSNIYKQQSTPAELAIAI